MKNFVLDRTLTLSTKFTAFTPAKGGRRPLLNSGARHTAFTPAKGGRRPLLNSGARHTVFTPAKDSRRPLLNSGARSAAFTLAEVLITLAVIGIVAALTIPNLVQNYKKRVVETKLQKVYSVMNNAIRLSEIENGPTTSWDSCGTSSTTTCTYNDVLAWYNKYLNKYLKTTKVEQLPDSETLLLYLTDGSVLSIANWIYDIEYYPEGRTISSGNAKPGVNQFSFRFQPNAFPEHAGIVNYKYVANPYFEPYTYTWNGTYEGAKHSASNLGCYDGGRLCTKLIQLNGWKIPDDYPWKF